MRVILNRPVKGQTGITLFTLFCLKMIQMIGNLNASSYVWYLKVRLKKERKRESQIPKGKNKKTNPEERKRENPEES